MLMKLRKSLLAAAAMAVVVTAAAPVMTYAEGAEKTVAIGIQSAWESLCPFFSTGNYTDIISDQIYDRLLVSNLDGSTEPRLAKDYEINEDHTAITFHLDENAKWQDGEPVTADDVVFSAQLDANPEFNSKKRDRLVYFAGTDDSGAATEEGIQVTADDEHTVTFQFKSAMNELPVITMFNRYFYVVPKHIYGEMDVAALNDVQTWIDAGMIGSGPFKFDTYVDGQSVEFTANEDYHLGAPKFDRLIIKVVEGSQMLSSLITGDIDVVAGAGVGAIPISDWPLAQETEGIHCFSVKGYAYQAMIFNLTSEKMTAEQRQAINMAIDKQKIVDGLITGEATALVGPFPDYHPYYAKDLDWATYDPEKAKQILEETGYDFDQTLELIVPTGNEIRIQSTVLIQQDLEAIGVKTNITQYDFTTLMAKMRDGDFDLGMCGSAGSICPDEPAGWLNNEGTANFTCVDDSRYMDLVNASLAETDMEKSKEVCAEFEQLIIDEMPISYLYSQNTLMAYRDRISNINPEQWGQLNWMTWTWDVAD